MTLTKAAIAHTCTLCWGTILAGSYYIRDRLTPWCHPDNESFSDYKVHYACQHEWSKVGEEHDWQINGFDATLLPEPGNANHTLAVAFLDDLLSSSPGLRGATFGSGNVFIEASPGRSAVVEFKGTTMAWLSRAGNVPVQILSGADLDDQESFRCCVSDLLDYLEEEDVKACGKNEFIKKVAEASGVDAKSVEAVFDSLESVVSKELLGQGEVAIPGVGKLKVARKAATKERQGLNPFTKAPMTIPAKPERATIKAVIAKPLRDAVGKPIEQHPAPEVAEAN